MTFHLVLAALALSRGVPPPRPARVGAVASMYLPNKLGRKVDYQTLEEGSVPPLESDDCVIWDEAPVRSVPEFKARVGSSCSGLSVVFFASRSCRSCRAVTPKIERVAVEYEGQADFFRVYHDDARRLFSLLGMRTMPTVQIYARDIGRVASFACSPGKGIPVLRRHLE